MMLERMEQNPGTRFLFNAALLVIVVGGLRLAAPILLPFSLALFLAILTLPIVVWLQQHRVPRGLAIFLAVLADIALFGLIILLASQSINDFQDKIPGYALRLTNLWNGWIEALRGTTFPGATVLADYLNPDLVNPGQFFTLAGGTLTRVFSFASNAFLVFIILVFTLAEATVFPAKFRAILGREHGHSSRLTKIVTEVQEYLGIKTFISLATGVLLGAWCWVLDLDFPILLGLVAFVLNYVPTIGSIIASVPAMILALIQYGPGHALIVSVGYVAVNLAFGNLIEPNLLGRRLGLSTLVVILSLIFWGWVWGAVGALLAVPLTMVVKIMLENTSDLRWVAILLDKTPPEPRGGVVLLEDTGD
ncbi:MAG: AI-2E family transporter [Gemmatimonadota bacterium]